MKAIKPDIQFAGLQKNGDGRPEIFRNSHRR